MQTRKYHSISNIINNQSIYIIKMQSEPNHLEDQESSIRKAPNFFEKIKLNLLNISINIIKK